MTATRIYGVRGSRSTKRTAEFQAQTGHTTCVFKGRRGPWFVQKGLKALLDKVPSATSMEFERSLASLPEQKQAEVLSARQQLRSRLLEMCTDKFSFWKHIPWSMLGIFYSENGSWAASKELVVACIAEYDTVMEQSSYNALHRVAHAVLNPDNEVGRDVREFAVDNLPLTAHPVAYFALQTYSLVPLVERRIESVHAAIKRLGKQAINVGVPWISSKLREQLLMNQLTDRDFRRCCLDTFRKRSLLDDILKLRFTTDELSGMRVSDKTNAVYQCSLAEQYDLRRAAHATSREFQLSLETCRPSHKLPAQCKLCVSYLKGVLADGGYFTVPLSFSIAWSSVSDELIYDSEAIQKDSPANVLVDAFTDLPEDFDFVGGHGVAALHIVNATPELRFHIDAPHLSQVKTSIIVSKLHVIGCLNQKRELVVQEYVGADALQELDLMYVLTRLPEFARSLFRWVPVGVRLSAVPRSKPAPWSDQSVAPPNVLSASVVSSALLDQASHEAIVNKTSTVKALSQIVSLSSASGSVHFDTVRSVPIEDIHDLAQHGLVTAGEDEFGALVLTVVRTKIEPGVMQNIGDPIHAI